MAQAQPESQVFGLAYASSGFEMAQVASLGLAWPGFGLSPSFCVKV